VKFKMATDIDGLDEIAVDVFKSISISQSDLNLFYRAFYDIDSSNAAVIRVDELFSYFKMTHSAFNQRLFASFDVNCDGYLNFCEFVACMWHLLSLDPMSEQFNSIVFDLYRGGSQEDGYICRKKLHSLLAGIHHNSKVRVSTMSEKIISMNGSQHEVSFQTFCLVVKDTPSILAPVVSMQLSLRAQLLGIDHWEAVSKTRAIKEGGQCIQKHTARMQKYGSLLRDKKAKRMYLRIKEEEVHRAIAQDNEKKLTDQEVAIKKQTSAMLGFFTLKVKLTKVDESRQSTKATAKKTKALPALQRRRKSSFLRPMIVKDSRSSSTHCTTRDKTSKVLPDIDDAVHPFDMDN
jgi:Ca2+-binding EF-hand superfamily protein